VSPTGRTQRCSEAHARTRLEHARAFRQVADLVEDAGPEFASAAAAHYGLFDVSGSDLGTAIRQADKLVTFAESIVAR
jgi:hypothetical protein